MHVRWASLPSPEWTFSASTSISGSSAKKERKGGEFDIFPFYEGRSEGCAFLIKGIPSLFAEEEEEEGLKKLSQWKGKGGEGFIIDRLYLYPKKKREKKKKKVRLLLLLRTLS